MPAITDTTRLRLSIEDTSHETTLGLFLADNTGEIDAAAVKAALGRGERFEGGGGAQPAWAVEVVS